MIPTNILIVDDHEENIIALKALLSGNDLVIHSTTSANEGLKLASQNHISIALVNVQIPAINGHDFAEMLKANPRNKHIFIFVTGASGRVKQAAKGFGSNVIDYLFKPRDPFLTRAEIDLSIQLDKCRNEIRRKNEEFQDYAVMVNNSADAICAVDAQSLTIRFVNPAVEQLLGFKPDILVGSSIIDIATEKQKAIFKLKLKDIITNNITSTVFEFQFDTYSKQTIWAECRIAYQNKTIFLNISGTSVQKGNQKQPAKSKQGVEYGNKVKETFLANMSHELRTPVNGIIGLTALLRKTELDEQQNSMIDLMEVSSQSLLGVINDVLDISKMEAGKFTIYRSANNLHDLIRSVYGLLKFKADEGNIEFLLEIEPDIPLYIMVDSLRLNQILMNLLSNAIKFTERGFVKLTVTAHEKRNNDVRLKFTIEDTGIGIPTAKLSKIFDSFEQAEDDTASKYGGTGLGLAIVKRLVELKEGEITVSSQPGKGSVFTFLNWYNIAAKPADSRKSGYASMDRFDNVTILVAEDNLVNQFMLAKMLKDWNVAVEMVDNGIKVLDKLRQNHYDLILMDTYMPEMNGYDAAKAIRADFDEPKRSIPIISLSAATFEREQQEAILAGMNDVLSKPFKPAELHRKIKRLLMEAGMQKKTAQLIPES